MTMLPEDRRFDEAILRAINQFSSKKPDESREQVYKSIDKLLSGIDEQSPKVKMVLDESSGLKIRFIDKEFKSQLTDLAKALKNIETPEQSQKYAKYDETIKLITIQVQKGDVIYQINQERGTASPTALSAYTEQKKQIQKAPKAVRALNAATQSLISSAISAKFLALIAPKNATVLPSVGMSHSNTAATSSIAARFFPQGPTKQKSTAPNDAGQRTPTVALQRHKISLGAPDTAAKNRQERQKEALEASDETKRRENARAEKRQDDTQKENKVKRSKP